VIFEAKSESSSIFDEVTNFAERVVYSRRAKSESSSIFDEVTNFAERRGLPSAGSGHRRASQGIAGHCDDQFAWQE